MVRGVLESAVAFEQNQPTRHDVTDLLICQADDFEWPSLHSGHIQRKYDSQIEQIPAGCGLPGSAFSRRGAAENGIQCV